MYASELAEQRKRQRKLERLLAVRMTEKQRAREVRERAIAAKKIREREVSEGMKQTWALEQQQLISTTRDDLTSYTTESEGSAHRQAHLLNQQNRELGAACCNAWDQRDNVHKSFYKTAIKANANARATKLTIENATRTRREHVHTIEAQRARDVVEAHKNTKVIKVAREPVHQPGLHLVKNVVSEKWQVEDYKSTGYHKLLTSKTARLYPADGGGAKVWRNVGASEQGMARASDVAGEVAAAALKMKEEKRKLAEFAAKERERAKAVRRLKQKVEEEEALVEEVATAERNQRRKKINALSTDCRFVEHQQTEIRKTQVLERKLNHDFERAFIRPDLNWDLNTKGRYQTNGNDTRVITADVGDDIPQIVSSSVEVSQHLKELFEIQQKQPTLCEPAVLSHHTVAINDGEGEQVQTTEVVNEAELAEVQPEVEEQNNNVATATATCSQDEVIETEQPAQPADEEPEPEPTVSNTNSQPDPIPAEPLYYDEDVVPPPTNKTVAAMVGPISTTAAEAIEEEYKTPEKATRHHQTTVNHEDTVSSPDQVSISSKSPKDAISVASHNMALLQVNIAGLQDRLKQLLELPPPISHRQVVNISVEDSETPSGLSGSSGEVFSSLSPSDSSGSPSSNGRTLSSSASDICTPESLKKIITKKRQPVIVNKPRPIPRPNIISDGWIRGGYSPSPSSGTGNSSSIASPATGDSSATVLTGCSSSADGYTISLDDSDLLK
eukprot:TRINITY_DN10512_c2_g2_i1.p1 TRINITY_DN10512_c2_g2~~TRINITY_DN10512_c2_g2_i1.p1  ORF type:complete len:728 (+),score=191.33 TRINITY_DN10512_c2_g2_i1:48-2231(+)